MAELAATSMEDDHKEAKVDEAYLVGLWRSEIERATKKLDPWQRKADKIEDRYRDDKSDLGGQTPRYNILYSNVQTLAPAVYAKSPKTVVQRRYLDKDPIARFACQILERATQYQVDLGMLHDATRHAVKDRLLAGRGTIWVCYEPEFMEYPLTDEQGQPVLDEDGEQQTEEKIEHETVSIDFVNRKDFLHAPARTWGEVPWVARRTYPSREELIEKFGPEIGEEIPLTMDPQENGREARDKNPQYKELQRAQVWEIWYKPEKKVYQIADGYEKLCKVIDDPLQLHDFFPCPKPLFSTLTNDSLIPVPDYTQYQAQAEEMNDLSNRIDKLIAACQVKGAYDSSQPLLARILTEGRENDMIPVDNWSQFTTRGGLKGSLDFLPIDQFSQVLQNLYNARKEVKADIYEITGISDIIRGQSQASETATAQRIKGQFATLRLKDMQDEVSRFVRDTIRIIAEIIAEQFQPETIEQMSGAAEMEGAQKLLPVMGPNGPQIDPQTGQPQMAMQFDRESFMQALQLLKDERMRGFRVDIETDSTITADEQAEQQARVQFLGAVGQYLSSAMPMVQQHPETAPLLGKMLLFGVRAFRAGRELESAFEEAIDKMEQGSQQPKPNPEADKAKMELEQAREKHQMDMEAKQADTQATVVKADAEVTKAKAEVEKAAIQHHMTMREMAAQQAVQPMQPAQPLPPIGFGQPPAGIA